MKRRHFLRGTAVISAGTIAGCSGSPEHRLQGEVWDGLDQEESEMSVAYSGQLTLEAGEYTIRDVTPDEETVVEVSFEVADGGPIDVMFLDRDEYDERYRDGEADDVEFLQQLSEIGSTGADLAHQISAGDHVLVMDNAGAFGTTPEGQVTIDLEVVIRQPTSAFVAEALEHVDAAGAEIEGQADQEGTSFDAAAVHSELEDARSGLDRAEGFANEEERAEIDALRIATAWYGRIADAFEALDAALTEFERANSLFQSERFEESEESLGTVADHLDDAATALADARAEYDRFDPSAIEDFDETAATSAMDQLEAYVETMQGFTDGYRDLVGGIQQFIEGSEHYANENWTVAIDPLEGARESFAAAEETFRNTEENAPSEIVSSMIELTCLAESRKDASSHFAEAARAAQDNDWSTAREEDEAGQSALDSC